MKPYHNSGLPGNGKALPVASLPLFQWAANRIIDPPGQPTSRAALTVARRFGLSTNIARLVAEHAGFNLEACE